MEEKGGVWGRGGQRCVPICCAAISWGEAATVGVKNSAFCIDLRGVVIGCGVVEMIGGAGETYIIFRAALAADAVDCAFDLLRVI